MNAIKAIWDAIWGRGPVYSGNDEDFYKRLREFQAEIQTNTETIVRANSQRLERQHREIADKIDQRIDELLEETRGRRD